ncbi:class I SAM-dependent methyltransferase [Geomonas sp. RF6]|uniref:class I SAM-dependent methyltransferase n=1 Tax=Geomonas sp. RF6 TaxID=2897342 RepID=UPI001E3C782C|nr:class I SAM-dependent methyltransferase [Geomonas sp. RF6]UFS69718.1 class I SAM-dependent methyltransferase [Geomonas sp. RF6]
MNKALSLLFSALHRISPVLELFLAPFTLFSALLLSFIRRGEIDRMPLTRKILLKVGVFPVVRHYYEPQFDHRQLTRPLGEDRTLPGVDLNVEEQLALLRELHYGAELLQFPTRSGSPLEYCYDNPFFRAGDSEFLYSMVRRFTPRTVIEIGSGNSTLMVRNALKKNAQEREGYRCRHVCIEPYEMPWLEQAGVEVIRERVETVDRALFAELGAGDILFVDSSHIIKPQGDVLAIYLEILPLLRSGVLVHVHDVLSPKDYFERWVVHEVKFWNEQYLLEAFLTLNNHFRIIGALNYLKHHHFEELAASCPVMATESGCEPGSFWMVRN